MIDWEEVFIKFIIAVLAVAVVACVVIVVVLLTRSFGNFEYQTFNGETGYSSYCYISRGGMFCAENGGYVQVESYKEQK